MDVIDIRKMKEVNIQIKSDDWAWTYEGEYILCHSFVDQYCYENNIELKDTLNLTVSNTPKEKSEKFYLDSWFDIIDKNILFCYILF